MFDSIHNEEVERRRAALRQADDRTIVEMEAEQVRQYLEPARILLDEIARRNRIFGGTERLDIARGRMALEDQIRDVRYWCAVMRDRKRVLRRASGSPDYEIADLAVDEAQAMLRRSWKSYRIIRQRLVRLHERLAELERLTAQAAE